MFEDLCAAWAKFGYKCASRASGFFCDGRGAVQKFIYKCVTRALLLQVAVAKRSS